MDLAADSAFLCFLRLLWLFSSPAMDRDIKQLCGIVRETAFSLHCFLKHGHLAHRLRKRGLKVQTQHPLKVSDEDGTVLGDYFADMFIEDCLIAEIKAVERLADEHLAQLLGYMRASGIEHGLLMNFGSARFEIHKYILAKAGRDGNKTA